MPEPQQPATLDVVRGMLIQRAGGFLRNVVWQRGLTCETCAGVPNGDYPRCYHCEDWHGRRNVADRLGFMSYAVDGSQSGRTMYAYKDDTSWHAWQNVRLEVVYNVMRHWACINNSELGPVTQWSVVPSLRGREALRTLAGPILGAQHLLEAPLAPHPAAVRTRELRPENFIAEPAANAHVLLIEDAWVGGGNAQSAAAALKGAGARAVTILTIARWLDRHRGRTPQLLDMLRAEQYNPDRCPFPGLGCLPAT